MIEHQMAIEALTAGSTRQRQEISEFQSVQVS